MNLKKMLLPIVAILVISCGSQSTVKKDVNPVSDIPENYVKLNFNNTSICLASSYTPGLSAFGKSLQNVKGFDSSKGSRKLIIPGNMISAHLKEYDKNRQISGLAHNIANVGNTSDLGESCAKTIGLCKESTVYKDIFYSYWLHISQIERRKDVQAAIGNVFADWEKACGE